MGIFGRPTIGFLIDWPETSTYHRELSAGAHEQAVREGVDLVFFCASQLTRNADLDHAVSASYDYIASNALDGVVLATATLKADGGRDRLLEKIGSWPQIPVVSISEELPGVPSVTIRKTDSFDRLMDHLFSDHGYQTPVFVSGPRENSDSNERWASFRAALERYKIPARDGSVYYGRYLFTDGEQAVRAFWDERGSTPDVVVCANDNMAFGVVHALKKRGIRVPQDVAVTGFDDLPFSEFCPSPLTTVRQPIKETGTIALSLVCDALKSPQTSRTIETSLVLRMSCGCNKVEDDAQSLLDRHHTEVLANMVRKEESELNSNVLDNIGVYYHSAGRIQSHEGLERELLAYLGLDDFYLVESERDARSLEEEAFLRVAWQSGQKIELPTDGIPFAQKSILPRALDRGDRQTYIVQNLFDSNRVFGSVVVSYSPQLRERVGLIRDRFSSLIASVRSTRQLKTLNLALVEASQKLEELSLTDELTKHFNRRGFMLHAERQLAYCRRNGEPFWVLFIDLDGLKKINDTYGHDDGDVAIRAFGEAIRKSVRETDVVARLGGDEFTALIAHSQSSTIEIVRARMDAAIERANSELARPWTLSYSLGGAYSKVGDKTTLEVLMQDADRILYDEKRKKKARATS